MKTQTDAMVHKPNDADLEILNALLIGRDEGKPWGRGTPSWIEQRVDASKQYILNRLQILNAAEYVRREVGGFYEITEVNEPLELHIYDEGSEMRFTLYDPVTRSSTNINEEAFIATEDAR